jgi:CobQ-like glutamine amidotransferase family enzyme
MARARFKLEGVGLNSRWTPTRTISYIGGGGTGPGAVRGDLATVKRDALRRGAAVVFAVCGGYQLLGHLQL